MHLPPRSVYSHKGDFGLVLLVGGCRGMAGAIALAGHAALVTGSGLVRVAVPDPILETVAGFVPEIMTVPLTPDRKGRISLDAFSEIMVQVKNATVVALGPGLGRSPGLSALVAKLYRSIDKPLVVDADALNALAEHGIKPVDHARILTPHPGEFARLIKGPVHSEQNESEMSERIRQVRHYAKKTQTTLLLKGHKTIISDGHEIVINQSGNPGMATGGSGDVLTGIISGLIAQGIAPFDAAVLGTRVHGEAGDFAAAQVGQPALTASSIIDAIRTKKLL